MAGKHARWLALSLLFALMIALCGCGPAMNNIVPPAPADQDDRQEGAAANAPLIKIELLGRGDKKPTQKKPKKPVPETEKLKKPGTPTYTSGPKMMAARVKVGGAS